MCPVHVVVVVMLVVAVAVDSVLGRLAAVVLLVVVSVLGRLVHAVPVPRVACITGASGSRVVCG